MNDMTTPDQIPEIWQQQFELLARIARGGALKDVLRDIVLLVEERAGGDMIASILLLSDDGQHLLEGAAPSLPEVYNQAIDGMGIGPNEGSCGSAAFSGEPVFVGDIATDPLWANYKDFALPHGLAACWSVPIKAADGKTIGTFANYFKESRQPTSAEMAAIQMTAHTASVAVEKAKSERLRAQAEEDRAMLIRELNHRVKNAFTLAQTIVSLSSRSASSVNELAEVAGGRLRALSAAHELSAHDGGEVPVGTMLMSELAERIFAPYQELESDKESRFIYEGDQVGLCADSAKSLGLCLHELTTNAAKYGALSAEGGKIRLKWKLQDKHLFVDWQEEGGPSVTPTEKLGFGSRLLQDAIERQLKGKVEREWRPEGLFVRVQFPLQQCNC